MPERSRVGTTTERGERSGPAILTNYPGTMPTFGSTRVLVTGGTGFIGSHLTRRLVAEGAEIHAITTRVSATYPWRLLDVREGISLYPVDLTDAGAVEALVAQVRPTHVFHLAADTHVGRSWQRIDECLQTNVRGTVTLLSAVAAHGCERFVHVSTSDVYGRVEVPFREDAAVNPMSPYAASKYAAECYCLMFHRSRSWPVVVLRPFNAYGPAQSPDRVIPELIVRALLGEDVELTQGLQTREFNYVEDLVEGMVRAACAPGIEGEVFNLGCGEEVAIREVVGMVLELLGNPIEARFGALPERPGEITRVLSDSSRARERLGWVPQVALRDGLERTAAWYRDRLAAHAPPFEP
jgi:UDP-glucose 4-epimerase